MKIITRNVRKIAIVFECISNFPWEKQYNMKLNLTGTTQWLIIMASNSPMQVHGCSLMCSMCLNPDSNILVIVSWFSLHVQEQLACVVLSITLLILIQLLSFLTGIIHNSKKRNDVFFICYIRTYPFAHSSELGLSVNITDCLAKKVNHVWSKTSMEWERGEGGGQYIYITSQFKFSVCLPVIIFNTAWRNLCNFHFCVHFGFLLFPSFRWPQYYFF